MECDYPLILEKEVKNILKKNVKLLTGTEFFEGDENIILLLFLKTVLTHKMPNMKTDFINNCINQSNNDFNNSIKLLNDNGQIFIGDILPLNYNEQLKIPIKHRYENGILKYGEEWTGDIWKFTYYLLLNYSDKIEYSYFELINILIFQTK
jgi:hypothetical protein